ncbi:hypothetical protein [Nonomuraea ceibae]|uniref:hypothetical protein n=1 Tax=Nonomuraea ceibae TaxID=1935170 RepID=UPI001C5FD9B7|nr:hypothetical protein [Nonomuraea ceibae]
MRDIAAAIGITERVVQASSPTHEAGYLTRDRVGRRNHYQIHPEQRFRYPTDAAVVRRCLDRPVRRLAVLINGVSEPDNR